MPLSPVGVRPLVSGRPDFRELSARAREGWTLSVLTGLRFSRWKTSGTEFCQRSARAREKRTVLDGAAALGPEFSSRSARAREKRTALAPAALRSVTVSGAQPESGAGGFSAPSALVFAGAFVGVNGHGRKRRAAGRFGRPLSAFIRIGDTSPGFFLRMLVPRSQAPPADSAAPRTVLSCTLSRRLRCAGFAVP